MCSFAAVQANDGPYLAAAFNSDLATITCLRRMGCAWDSDGATFTKVIEREDGCCLEVLQRLHAEGCPVDWRQARAALRRARFIRSCDKKEMRSWLEGQMRAAPPDGEDEDEEEEEEEEQE